MPDYNMTELSNQVFLVDTKFNWKERKKKAVQLSEIFSKLVDEVSNEEKYIFFRKSNNTKFCAHSLEFRVNDKQERTLEKAIFCKDRLCPVCSPRRAKKTALELSKVLTACDEQNQDMQYIFLTLTMKNVLGDELKDSLSTLTKSWSRLMKQRPVMQAVKGWFRALEITTDGKQYHPHIHAILAVNNAYFSKRSKQYITQPDWVTRWQKALKVDYKPSVRIQATRVKTGSRYKSKGLAAVQEAAKYTTKDSDYLSPKMSSDVSKKVVHDYSIALRGRRLIGYGGVLKKIAEKLNVDEQGDDLLHIDEDAMRNDVAELLEVYHWNFGVCDYILCYSTPCTD